MRILLLNYEFPPLGGGASQATYFMARELVRRGHTVDVLTSSHASQPPTEILHGINVQRVRSWRRGVHEAGLLGVATYLLFALLALRRLLRRNQYDVAQFFFALPTGALALYWRHRTDRPYIVSLRGSDVPGYDPATGTVQFLHRILKPVTHSILARAAHVVANSESLRQLALESYPDLNISVTTNGVDSSLYRPRTQPSSPDATLKALSVSRLVQRKGLETMLEALAQQKSNQVALSIAGDGPMIGDLQELASKLEIQERVTFLGVLKGEALREAYRSADFFVLPSLQESFSMSLLEAMSSGLPIIASNTGGIPELVNDRENGILVPPGDAAALSAAMTEMAESPRLRQTCAANNVEKVASSYSWATITSEYLARYYPSAQNDQLEKPVVESGRH